MAISTSYSYLWANERSLDGLCRLPHLVVMKTLSVFLIETGLDPNTHEGAFGTALQMAAVAGREKIVHLLIERQANLDHNYDQFGTALQVAAAIGNHNLVRLLLDKGADPTISGGGFGMKAARLFSQAMNDASKEFRIGSALEAAAESGYEGIVRTILEWYSMNGRADDLRAGGEFSAFWALQKASTLGNTEIVQLLLENGVPISSGYADSPLECACKNGHERTVRILLDQPGQPDRAIGRSLLAAIDGKHESIVELLLNRGKTIKLGRPHLYSATYQGDFQRSAMLLACFRGNGEIVKLLLNNNVDVNLPCAGPSANYPLHAAAFQGQYDIVELLISRGASVNSRGGDYETALIAASFQGHARIVEILIENGADLNFVTKHRSKMGTALQAAAHNGHANVVEYLLGKSADVNAKGGMYGTAIQAAAFFDHEEVVRLLIRWGANLRDQGGEPEAVSTDGASIEMFKDEEYRAFNFLSSIVPQLHSSARSQNGKFGTALQAAAVNGNAQIIRLLLEHGADAGDRDMHGQTPLHRAAYHGHEEAVSVLLEYGTAIETKDVCGRTALSWAAVWGYDKLLKILSQSGASIDERDSSGKSALHQAAFNGQLKIMKHLLEKGANLERSDSRRRTPLFSALQSGRFSSICFLLGQGACVTHRDCRGLTVLHEAALAGYNSMIRPILAAGLDIDAKSSTPFTTAPRLDDEYFPAQSTPLHLAAIRGNYELSYLLMLNGADVDAQNEDGETPLHLAAKGGFYTIVTLLLKWRAKLKTDRLQRLPLHLAVRGGHHDTVRLLLERGANIDARDRLQQTPLHYAIRDKSNAVRLLLDNGADDDARNKDGDTPLHLRARESHRNAQSRRNHDDIIELLLERGSDPQAKNHQGEIPLTVAHENTRLSIENTFADEQHAPGQGARGLFDIFRHGGRYQ